MNLTIQVNFLDGYSDTEIPLAVTGDSLVPFRQALIASLPQTDPEWVYFVVVSDLLSADREVLILDSTATVGQVASLFQGETVRIDNSGRGGGGFWVSLTDLAQALPHIGSAIRTTRGVYGVALEVRYRSQRAAIKEWDDMGTTSRDLEQFVLAENPWLRWLFDRTFGLPRDRGGALLREFGYYRSGIDEHGWELWRRNDPDWSIDLSSELPRG